jgi:hypothetical protein
MTSGNRCTQRPALLHARTNTGAVFGIARATPHTHDATIAILAAIPLICVTCPSLQGRFDQT